MKIDTKDKTKIQFNNKITITNIPKEAWDYKINDWSAIKWIMERYKYKKDRDTELVTDPNTYSEDPAYILKLLLSVISVSIKTMEIVNSLPSLNLKESNKEINLDLLLKRALVFTMISDGKIKEVEKESVVACYKKITNRKLPKAEIDGHLKGFEKDWDRESLMEDFLNCNLSEEKKGKILKGITQVIMSDRDADEREIDFLQSVSNIIQFPEDKLQEMIGSRSKEAI